MSCKSSQRQKLAPLRRPSFPNEVREIRRNLSCKLNIVGRLCWVFSRALKSSDYLIFPIIFQVELSLLDCIQLKIFSPQVIIQVLCNIAYPAPTQNNISHHSLLSPTVIIQEWEQTCKSLAIYPVWMPEGGLTPIVDIVTLVAALNSVKTIESTGNAVHFQGLSGAQG